MIQQASHSEPRGSSPQRNRSSSRTSNETLDQFIILMTAFVQRTKERDQASTSTLGGDVIPEFNPEDKRLTVAIWYQKVDKLHEMFK